MSPIPEKPRAGMPAKVAEMTRKASKMEIDVGRDMFHTHPVHAAGVIKSLGYRSLGSRRARH